MRGVRESAGEHRKYPPGRRRRKQNTREAGNGKGKKEEGGKKITKICHLGLPLYRVLSLRLPEYKEVLLSVPMPLAHDNSTGYISGNKQLLDL